jgi:hypothetical protein
MCSGKTVLQGLMEREDMHLVEVPLLCEAVAEGYNYVPVDLVHAFRATGRNMRELNYGMEDRPYLVVDACVSAKEVAAAFAETRVVQVVLVAPWYLVAARRRLRLVMDGIPLAAIDNHPRYVAWANTYYSHNYREQMVLEGVEEVWVNTADCPWRVEEDPDTVLRPMFAWPYIDDPTQLYQQALHIGEGWYGNRARVGFEQARLDAVLPADCAGLTVLDVGSSEGGFCFEALNRGAVYTMGLELRQPQVDLMVTLRSQTFQALSVAQYDVNKLPLPVLYDRYGEARLWGLTLLLNVLHRVEDPGKLLREALVKSERVVVEAPFCMGTEPGKPEDAKYPGTWHLPPAWVTQVAHAHGFGMKRIEVGPYVPEQRLIFEMSREAFGGTAKLVGTQLRD